MKLGESPRTVDVDQRFREVNEKIDGVRRGIMVQLHFQEDTIKTYARGKELDSRTRISLEVARCAVIGRRIDGITLQCVEAKEFLEEGLEQVTAER